MSAPLALRIKTRRAENSVRHFTTRRAAQEGINDAFGCGSVDLEEWRRLTDLLSEPTLPPSTSLQPQTFTGTP